jgi:hypothetical protein
VDPHDCAARGVQRRLISFYAGKNCTARAKKHGKVEVGGRRDKLQINKKRGMT